MSSPVPAKVQRWIDAGLIDGTTAHRITDFEEQRGGGRRIATWIAIAFGVVLLCAGVLMFVSAHWDKLGPWPRFSLVLAMVAIFHVAGLAASHQGHAALAIALHGAGTVSAGGGVFMVGQIFNLAEHWPGGILLWALAATAGWWLLRDWVQLGIMALLWPAWMMGEWTVRIQRNHGGDGEPFAALIALSFALAYFTSADGVAERSSRERVLEWIGGIALLPALYIVPEMVYDRVGDVPGSFLTRVGHPLPPLVLAVGWALALLPPLALIGRRGVRAFRAGALALLWVVLLAMISVQMRPGENLLLYMWMMVGGCGMVGWGMIFRRIGRVNMGIVIFAFAVILFYFSDFLDKLDRSIFFVGLGICFLLGGWLLERTRRRLLARMRAEEVVQ